MLRMLRCLSRPVSSAAVILGVALALPAAAELKVPPASYAYRAAEVCPVPTAVYKGCEDQMAAFSAAFAEAKAQGKLLLVVFGADWCPWCRALDITIPSDQILGFKGDGIDYRARFHVVKIATSVIARPKNARVPSGDAVMNLIIAETPGVKPMGIPFLAVINPATGKVFARNTEDLENNAGNEKGHHAEKVRAVLKEAEARLR